MGAQLQDPDAMQAFRAVYQSHYGFVWSVVRRMGVRADAIEDAVQDSFLTAFRRWGDLPDDRSRPWLYGIARRVSSNYRRGESRRARKHEALRHRHPSAAEFEGRVAAAQAVDRFLGALDERDRELFVLGEVEGFTGKELAEALSARPSTLYGRLATLRARFRENASDGAEAALREERSARPLAKASGWVVLLPQLNTPATLIPWWMSLGGMAKVAAVVSVVAVGTVTVATAHSAPTQAPAQPQASADPPPEPRVQPHPHPAGPATTAAAQVPVESPPSAPASESVRRHRPTARAKRSDPLAEEAALVHTLKEHMSEGDMEAALRTTHEHARRFPKGALVDAVAALRVEALCRAGKQAQARGEVRSFLAEHEGSPVAHRVARACRE